MTVQCVSVCVYFCMFLLFCTGRNFFYMYVIPKWDSLMVQQVKISTCNAGDTGDADSIPGSGRFPGGGNGNSLQYLPGKSYWQRKGSQRAGHSWVTRHAHTTVSNSQMSEISVLSILRNTLLYYGNHLLQVKRWLKNLYKLKERRWA